MEGDDGKTHSRWVLRDNKDNERSWDDGEYDECVRYCIGQLERGKQKGYKHWQIYLCTKQPVRMAGIKKMFPRVNHIEIARGSTAQNQAYVHKDDTCIGRRFTYGDAPAESQGSRSDLHAVSDLAMTGVDLRTLVTTFPTMYLRYGRNMEKLAAMYAEKRALTEDPTVFIWYGAPGTGKTRLVMEYARDLGVPYYKKPGNNKWWDGYMGEKVVIIDDFAGGIPYDELLNWFQRYEHPVEYKGGTTQLLADTFLITSNFPSAKWYQGASNADQRALKRRITCEQEM